MALVRFVVYDSDRYLDDFIGYNVVPVLSMQEGKFYDDNLQKPEVSKF